MNKESYKKAFEKYFSGNYSKRLLVPIANYSDLYVQFTDALLEDDKRLRQLKIEKTILSSNISTASNTVSSIISDIQKNIDAKSAENQSLTEERIETTWTLSIIGLIAALALSLIHI